MTTIVTRFAEKRVLFACVLIALLAVLFWTGSRYPQLDEKAMMSGAIQLEDPISFDVIYPITADMSVVEQIWKTTVNWVNTNKKGMTFGVLIAAAFLTLFGYLQKRSFKGGFSNAFLGLAMGAPLGVCVNCAAPIARGLYAGGMRAEATLSAMIASPTLNVIVLTMTFSLLPFYMAAAKIALSLFVILVAIPLICRLLPKENLQRETVEVPAPTGWNLVEQESLFRAFFGFVLSYAKNLWFIIKTTVPLMLLAGFLGAVAATLLPQDLILGLGFSLAILLMIAIVGTFLPVPIAFDVVLAGALLSGGLTHGYVFALLFTLGSFSIYSYMIVFTAISARAANYLAGAIIAIGVIGGAAAHSYHTWQTNRALELLLGWSVFNATPIWAADFSVESRPYKPRSPAFDTVFQRREAIHNGIDKPLEFSMKDMWPPFWEGRSVSTGDIDHDGDLDVIIASTERGIYLYLNDGAGQFTAANPDLSTFAERDIFNAALVDIDNDGWLDLFLATYLEGNYLIPNRQGSLDFANPATVENRTDAMLSLALSFGDPDQDGDLDAVLGNWAAGWYRRIPGEESRNRILWNENGVLDGKSFADLTGLPGETLSILFSDIDNNGTADLLVGNDFELPDYVYLGDGAGGLTAITQDQGIIPHTTNTTMAIKSADLLNNGMPELYFAQIAGRSSGVSERLKMQPLQNYCDVVENPDAKELCTRNMKIKSWYRSGNRFDPSYAARCQELSGELQAECKAMLVKDLAIQKQDGSICSLIPSAQKIPRAYCDIHFKPFEAPLMSVYNQALPQIRQANVLLAKQGEVYTDTAVETGLEVGGWSWDTKIADFDNDGWQDVYIVNGTWVPNEVSPSNLFFQNNGDGTFSEASGPFGLEDYLMTAAATAFDMDLDGDLDILAHPVNGPMVLFENGGQTGNSATIELRDEIGNSHGIGARLTAELPSGITLTREVQIGGGFMSFDTANVHFGLGADTQIKRLTIRWANGGETVVDNLPHGAIHRITRR